MKAIFDQHIGIFEEAIPKDWCNEVIDIFEKNKLKSTSRQKANQYHLDVQDHSLELTDYSVPHAQIFIKHFWDKFFPLYFENQKLDIEFVKDLKLVGTKVQKTLPTEGYHVWHFENSQHVVTNRHMVYTVYLNDIEEGGETEFLLQSKRIKPTQGTLSIFPASYTHVHRGNPPLSGAKYIMTGWVNIFPKTTK